MEKRGRETITKRKRKKHQTSSSSRSRLQQYADADILFAVVLAALSNDSDSLITIIKPCLDQLRLSLLSETPNPIPPPHRTIPIPILSLLPPLINSKCAEIATSSLEIVGAASLFSFEMNEQIALDGEIVKGLISAVASSKRRRSISLAACNALLDLSTTSIGRLQLLQYSAIHKLIFCFIQAPKSSAPLVSLFAKETGSETCPRIGFKEDGFPVVLLDAAVTLTNTCTVEQLEKIPATLSESLLSYLKNLWREVHKQMLVGTSLKFNPGNDFYLSNIGTNDLAESIFRLSINAGQFPTTINFKEVERGIFGLAENCFEEFMLNHWEVSPLLIRRPSKALSKHDDIFSSFVQFLRSEEAVPAFLSSILQNFTSSLPIVSDELDVLKFLKEVRNHLGCPIIYQQDIRVLKTQHVNREMHFFQERSSGSCCFQAPHVLYVDDILRCEEAYKEGYTIAVRGMEFRFESIAAIADGLASLFGQPSAGVNMYMTPRNSQGLACHRDDHCVLVCQLIGVKRWTIFPQSSIRLPRLYEPTDSWQDSEGRSLIIEECKEFLLREGDVLYIPRGFPHEACTVIDNDGPSGNPGFSLHLTLAIEVEPPFEWEGFAHVALHHWDQSQNLSECTPDDSLSCDLNVVAVNLMHVAIKLIGEIDPTFRKACLVGAISLPSVAEDWLEVNQRMEFRHLLDTINTKSRFMDALKSVETAIQKHEDPFHEIRWLQHLNKEGEMTEGGNWNVPSIGTENFFHLFGQHKDKAEAAFLQVKSKFCSEVVFEDVEHSYKVLVEKYRKARKQYMNGMLSLHCN